MALLFALKTTRSPDLTHTALHSPVLTRQEADAILDAAQSLREQVTSLPVWKDPTARSRSVCLSIYVVYNLAPACGGVGAWGGGGVANTHTTATTT